MARLFVAVDVPESVKETLATIQQNADLRGAKWTKPSNWHLTLHFIGEAEIAPVDAALQTVQAKAFHIALKGPGVFPSQGRPRVLWAGLDAPPQLFDLHKATGEALQTTGYQPEARAYHPHITLARFKQAAPGKNYLQQYLDSHTTLSSEPFRVAHITLYESTLKSSGAVYTVRGQYNFS